MILLNERKNKVSGHLEREGIAKSIQTAQNADIILLVLDASEIISSQDMQLAGLIEKEANQF